MKHQLANFTIIQDDDTRLVLVDSGPWDKYPTITNSVEGIVEKLTSETKITNRQRLFYFDSEGDFAEIIIKKNKFHAISPADPDLLI